MFFYSFVLLFFCSFVLLFFYSFILLFFYSFILLFFYSFILLSLPPLRSKCHNWYTTITPAAGFAHTHV
ncbi:hypothetical protein F9939_18010 [Bacteroides stercoris]|nr:hypothetical protein F9991_14005 [Bacteroides stercoris]KAB5305902.1 hypothetical protein F9939_18010 [Bacteroides stercoris]